MCFNQWFDAKSAMVIISIKQYFNECHIIMNWKYQENCTNPLWATGPEAQTMGVPKTLVCSVIKCYVLGHLKHDINLLIQVFNILFCQDTWKCSLCCMSSSFSFLFLSNKAATSPAVPQTAPPGSPPHLHSLPSVYHKLGSTDSVLCLQIFNFLVLPFRMKRMTFALNTVSLTVEWLTRYRQSSPMYCTTVTLCFTQSFQN